jgi:hypothetical protein
MSLPFLEFLGEEVKKSTLQLVVGWLGNALALFFFFSPAVKIYGLLLEKIPYTEFSYLSLMANIMNCILWFVYGYKRDTLEIWVCNEIGGTTSLIYLIIFWFFFCQKNTIKFLLYFFGTLAFLAGIFSVFYWTFKSYEVAGKTAMVFNILMYAAPGQKLVNYFLIWYIIRLKYSNPRNIIFYLLKVLSLDYSAHYVGSHILFWITII